MNRTSSIANQYEKDFFSVMAKYAHPVYIEPSPIGEVESIVESSVLDLSHTYRKKLPRLAAWIVVTEEYGRPSDENIDDFLLNFSGFLKRRSFVFSEEVKAVFDEMFLTDDYHFTGGFRFFTELGEVATQFRGRDFEAAVRDYIKSWQ